MKGLATQRGRPPAEIRPYLGQVAVTTARAYEIHAVALFEGIVFVQVIDDRGMPTWWPAWLLDLTDRSLPPDWICNLFPGQPAMVLGPELVARDQDSYTGMVELDAEQLKLFWAHVDATTRLLVDRSLGRPCGQECVDWAISMLEKGRDGRHLRMLAGMMPPFSPFELADLRDRALRELALIETADR